MKKNDRLSELVIDENKSCFKSIECYGQVIGFEMNKTVEIINKAAKLFIG
jgi:hypothetical protein